MNNISYDEALLKREELKKEINDLNLTLNEKKSEEKLLNKFILEKQNEINKQLLLKKMVQEDEIEMAEYIKKNIFFSIPEKLLNKYSNIIKSKNICLTLYGINFSCDSWETIKDDYIYKITTTNITDIYDEKNLRFFSLDKFIEPIKDYIKNECLPFEVYYSLYETNRFFIPERLKNKGFSISEESSTFNGRYFHIYLKTYYIDI